MNGLRHAISGVRRSYPAWFLGQGQREQPRPLEMPWLGIAFLMTGLIVIGLRIVGDYGSSWDEYTIAPYANETIEAFLRRMSPTSDLGRYGPVYFVFAELFSRAIQATEAGWPPHVGRHFAYFLTLPISATCLYWLARRWVRPWAAFSATLLFASQPLIFGHSFINPKDSPFMAFFLISVALGARLWDRLGLHNQSKIEGAPERDTGLETALRILRSGVEGWRISKPSSRSLLSIAGMALAVELLGVRQVILPTLLALVTGAYHQSSWAPLNRLFELVAQESSRLPLEAYLHKTRSLYSIASRPAAIVAVLPVLSVVARHALPYVRRVGQPPWFGQAVLAGLALGLTTSIRVAGPLAGVLVSTYSLARARRSALLPLAVYWFVASLACYASWPHLWSDPWTEFYSSLRSMSEFEWPFPVLFRGALVAGDDLPSYFVPYMFAVQLTLPALLLGGLGAVRVGHRIARGQPGAGEQAIMVLWLVGVVTLTATPASTRYDNGRHFLFGLPPLFLLASLGLDSIMGVGRYLALRPLLAGAVVLPALVSLIRLHPYQYVYYNELVGGVTGAYRQFELDYWATSYSQGVGLVNGTVPQGSIVLIHGPWENVWDSLRSDLVLYDVPQGEADARQADYVIVTTRANMDYEYLPFGRVIGAVDVDGAHLTAVVQVTAGQESG